MVISLLFGMGVIQSNETWTTYDVKNAAAGLQDFVICIEMLVAALAHAYSFPPRDYLPVRPCHCSCLVGLGCCFALAGPPLLSGRPCRSGALSSCLPYPPRYQPCGHPCSVTSSAAAAAASAAASASAPRAAAATAAAAGGGAAGADWLLWLTQAGGVVPGVGSIRRNVRDLLDLSTLWSDAGLVVNEATAEAFKDVGRGFR